MIKNSRTQLIAKAKAGSNVSKGMVSVMRFIRYPGGKQRILRYLLPYLPKREEIEGRYIEPFLGGGSVFFAINPMSASLSDLNRELIDLYRGIRDQPSKVWRLFQSFPATKSGYYDVRSISTEDRDIAFRAARTLFLNRTCFKGMWRHNANGEFNVGYGGQDRRWAINEENLSEVSLRLRRADIECSDFEKIIDDSSSGDFIFLDPPYSPGKSELFHSHYTYNQFTYMEQERLAIALKRASQRKVRWAVTISAHARIISLYEKANRIIPIPMGTGHRPGIMLANSGEVLIANFRT